MLQTPMYFYKKDHTITIVIQYPMLQTLMLIRKKGT
jgi:hypothetical protein